MSVPVLPRPALQWIAIAPFVSSAIYKNLDNISFGGHVPSVKKH